ncbi:MAG TPA: CDP-alcohol phosphatidyltransferase family protein [Ardenticatenaceae bacterium]|nr:CDP-alcohol phosphatidyltransferase family protein [Ardenticatenaceae bacterium]
MVSDWLRIQMKPLLGAAVGVLARFRVSPNFLTLVGFGFMVAIGLVLARGQFVLGGLLIILAGIFDALDGGLARATGQVTRFGAFLDSTLDRWAEAALYAGLLWYYSEQSAPVEVMLVYATIIGSLLVSYTRARAEGLGLELKEGWFTRFERIALLVLALFVNQMLIGLVLLAFFSNLTAIQRILAVRTKLNQQ